MCEKCPEFTVSAKNHVCVAADKIVTSAGIKYSPYNLSAEYICNHEVYKEHSNICITSGVMGPISDLF